MEKQKVRDWMKQREDERKRLPPPSPEEIRRQLGPVPPTKKRG